MAVSEATPRLKGWTCQRVQAGERCGHFNPSRKKVCQRCGKPKPPRRRPDHLRALETPYEEWVARFGERCNICGAQAGTRRLHRDHDHGTGKARGVLCFRCNTALPNRVDADWLRRAADYLERGRV